MRRRHRIGPLDGGGDHGGADDGRLDAGEPRAGRPAEGRRCLREALATNPKIAEAAEIRKTLRSIRDNMATATRR